MMGLRFVPCVQPFDWGHAELEGPSSTEEPTSTPEHLRHAVCVAAEVTPQSLCPASSEAWLQAAGLAREVRGAYTPTLIIRCSVVPNPEQAPRKAAEYSIMASPHPSSCHHDAPPELPGKRWPRRHPCMQTLEAS